MKRYIPIYLALSLGGCTAFGGEDGLTTDDLAPNERNQVQQMVDTFTNAETPKQQAFVACVGVVAVAESLLVDAEDSRIEPGGAKAQVERLQVVAGLLRQDASGDWSGADKARVVREFEPVVSKLARRYAISFAGDLATLDWSGALSRVRVIGFKVLSIAGVLSDGRKLLDQVAAGERTEDDVLTSCDGRVGSIKDRLALLAGVA